jgi:membrane associated rhomboid family serine protease
MTDHENSRQAAGREPLFNAPPLAMLVPVLLITLYFLQSLSPGLDAQLSDSFALSPLLLRSGAFDLLVTHQFLHGSWPHVLINSAFCLAFAAPLIRAFGRGAGGAASYIAFFLICGVAAGLGYCVLNWSSPVPVVGASGAISGLMGGAIRLGGGERDPILRPFLHPQVVSMAIIYCGANAATAVMPSLFGVDLQIAWQAHIAGFLFGLVAISPWLHLFHRRHFTTK